MKVFIAGNKLFTLVLALLSVGVMLLLAACGSTPGYANNSPLASSGTSTSKNSENSSPHFEIELKHSPIGTTDLSWNPKNDELLVKISLTGLAPNSSHAAHIHAGTCAVDGSVVYPLNSVVADAQGNAVSETKIEHVRQGIPAHGWYINVHNGLTMSDIDHRPISCGNIANSDTSKKAMQSVHVTMGTTSAPNEAASGKATLTSKDGKFVLTITLDGLQPNSKHIAHIHAGSCEAQGAVLVMLNSVVANADGKGTSSTTIEHLPSSNNGMYINVHTGATMSELSQPVYFNPIVCGNTSKS
ncbi:CHRD domain-containing protein [Ktedonosporobacter rubrisoli]|uniref:CHRD domain-containing protein n=1 Tax=Ktedonosporobacter rubrisoli TaxID=2509675 RepID=A0A4V0YYW5_KTERU|nr:CHRD domain-containing protein [Ktedonosporobacter rubrisoli]QBD77641.1 CHRD domain-containing protein [Ktedonosporobacter rubrisoli]